MIGRRDALRTGVVLLIGGLSGRARAQGVVDTSNFAVMDQTAARPVRLPPKPGAGASLSGTDAGIVERRLRCPCGCSMSVYECRTTDPVCQVSPAIHRDVMALIAGGHGIDEIMHAFADVYGERILLAPRARGIYRLAYILPPLALIAGLVGASMALRRRGARADA